MTIDELYEQAANENIFLVEYAGMPAAAGDTRDLEWIAAHADPPRTPQQLLDDIITGFMGAVVDLCILGTVKGDDRVANCISARDGFVKLRDEGFFPRVAEVRKELGLPVHDTKPLGRF